MEEEGVGHAREGREDLSGLSDEGFAVCQRGHSVDLC
jgi:hypothetical protein